MWSYASKRLRTHRLNFGSIWTEIGYDNLQELKYIVEIYYIPSQGFELGIELGIELRFEIGIELGLELGFELGIQARNRARNSSSESDFKFYYSLGPV